VNILITGSTGILGQALSSHLALSGEVIGLSRRAAPVAGALRHVACDLLDGPRTTEVFHACRPDIVIHTQALSDVDRCELEPDAAWAQNVTTTAHVVEALTGTAALLVHVSTDYVFDGAKGAPYEEGDEPHPLSVYGRAKVESERIALRYPRSVVVRTSTLFGPGRMNFCDHIVSRVTAGKTVEAFADQVTSPTYTRDLAEGIDALSRVYWESPGAQWPRICHVANAGSCSRATFAQRVVDLLGCSRDLIRLIPMAAQGRPAPRPPYSALGTVHIPQLIGRTMRSWDEALSAYLCERHSIT
jgi:dTDP-4-dehydrorhamnose reductase